MNLNEEYGDPDEPWKQLSILLLIDVKSEHYLRHCSSTERGALAQSWKTTPKVNTLPAIQYIPCLSMTTLFEGPAAIAAPIVTSFGPTN
jgi:hypothetical protein